MGRLAIKRDVIPSPGNQLSRWPLRVYDAGPHNCSRNRARNWIHSRIWRTRDCFLSTPPTGKTAVVPFMRVCRKARAAPPKRLVRFALASSRPPAASPPAEKTTARQDQTRQSGTRNGTGNAHATATRNSVVETEPCSAEATHRFIECNLDAVIPANNGTPIRLFEKNASAEARSVND